MEENDLLRAKATHAKALDLALPCGGWLISERGVKAERLLAGGSARRGQKQSIREAL